ncbi:hypothetical protein C7K25_02310 [Gulosibacter molinativorax]|uniref:MftR C-terminal domain-containing protein n=1 Tax=Gulosibacter molinativorax TaxID=256821 RepID=A0ABT7C6B3_9MICO|nr:hypothetical protein [Gulosibacter molinativorax]QUY61629.1 Hypotetical protein [Gulosibacter molinativorax]
MRFLPPWPQVSLGIGEQGRSTIAPELASKEQAWITAHEEHYITIILARFDAQRYEPATGMTRQSEARLVITLGTALIHYLAGLWPDSIPTDAEAQELTQTAIEAIRRIVSDPLR